MLLANQIVGLGDVNAKCKVYIANRPNMSEYQNLSSVKSLTKGEVSSIGQACGNGWRKVFNVYAKLLFALKECTWLPIDNCESWQEYRDKQLLQQGCNSSLLFSPPAPLSQQVNNVHIIMGKTYAKSLPLSASLRWLDNDFAINPEAKLLVCPYFDYRQLSNIKIIRLVELIQSLMSKP